MKETTELKTIDLSKDEVRLIRLFRCMDIDGIKPKNESSVLLLSFIIYVTKGIARTNHEPDAD